MPQNDEMHSELLLSSRKHATIKQKFQILKFNNHLTWLCFKLIDGRAKLTHVKIQRIKVTKGNHYRIEFRWILLCDVLNKTN